MGRSAHDEKRHKKSKKSSRKRKSRGHDERHEEIDEHEKSRHAKKQRRSRYSSSSESSHDDDSSRSSYSRNRKVKKSHKESKKHKKKKSRKQKKKKQNEKKPKREAEQTIPERMKRNYELADALVHLLNHHPDLASDLPIMLIRLARGTTFSFDPAQMHPSVAEGLSAVFTCLQPFGVVCQGGTWAWQNPSGSQRQGKNNDSHELVLVKIVHALLNEIGINITAFRQFEQDKQTQQEKERKNDTAIKEKRMQEHARLKQETQDMLKSFQTNGEDSLASELIGIVKLILDGESINVNGLANHELRDALSSLFLSVGLEQFEMENDSDDEESEEEKEMGFGLPEVDEPQESLMVRNNLFVILQECQLQSPADETANVTTAPSKSEPPKRRVLGPSLPSAAEAAAAATNDSSSEDEGPLPIGQARRKQPQGPVIQAAPQASDNGEDQANKREEWMMVPGEHQFLQGIQSSGVLKNRSFVNKKTRHEEPEQVVDPSVQAEMDAIHEAHAASRGPSLMDQHLQNKKEQQLKEQAEGKKKNWKWSRQDDLDSDRRVDKNALRMMMGGAQTDLTNKFQGGYGRG